MNSNALTPTEIGDLERLEAKIEKTKDHFVECGLAIMEVRERRLYRRDYDTFEAYCQERWGWGARRARQLALAAEFWQKQKSLEDSGKKVEVPENENQARRMMTEKKRTTRSAHAAKPCNESNLEVVTNDPEPVGTSNANDVISAPLKVAPVLRSEVMSKLLELDRLAMRLSSAHGDWNADPNFRKLIHEVHTINALVQGELFPEHFSGNKARANLPEIVQFFAAELPKLPRTDAEWFFNHMEGTGWSNGGKPVKDWKATIRAWFPLNIFPSQKTPNGYGSNRSSSAKGFDRNKGTLNEGTASRYDLRTIEANRSVQHSQRPGA